MPFESEAGLEAEMRRVASADDADTRDEIWLLGQPTLADFLEHARKAVDGGSRLDRRLLVDAWREANDHYADLEQPRRASPTRSTAWTCRQNSRR